VEKSLSAVLFSQQHDTMKAELSISDRFDPKCAEVECSIVDVLQKNEIFSCPLAKQSTCLQNDPF
jgi:hypothetical protein